jgi:hypothetical protein
VSAQIGPVLITGLDRSGKTALRAILDESREISFFRRSYLWTRVRDRFGDLRDDRQLAACIAALGAHPEFRERGVDFEAVAREMADGPRTYADLFQRIGARIAAAAGRSRWGAQEGGAEERLDAVFEDFPTARVVYMVRDPRDRHADLVADRRSAGLVPVSARRWRDSVRAIRDAASGADGRCLVVRYEDLVTEPAATVRKVCAFIGEPEPERVASAAAAWIARAGIDYDPERIGTWSARLPAWEVAYLQARLGAEMASLGYAVAPIRLSASDRARWLAAVPIGIVTAAARFVRARLGRHGRDGSATRRGAS